MADPGGITRVVDFGGAKPVTNINNYTFIGSNPQIIDGYSALRALTVVQAQAAKVATLTGVVLADSLGAGQLYWDDTETGADNGGTIIRLTANPAPNPGAWKRAVENGTLNVKWWGGQCNRTTNDRAAWLAMLPLLLSGHYAVLVPGFSRVAGGGLNLTSLYNCTLMGIGPGASGIVFDDLDGELIDDAISASNSSGTLRIHNMSIEGSDSFARAINIQNPGLAGCDIDNVWIKGFTRIPATAQGTIGALVANCNNAHINRVHVYECGQTFPLSTRKYAILVPSPAASGTLNSNIQIRNCVIEKGTTVGIMCFDSELVEMSNNSVDLGGVLYGYDGSGGDGYGIGIYNHYTASPTRVLICNNRIRNTFGSGIYVQTIPYAVVSENTLENTALVMWNGISLVCGAIAAPNSNFSTITNNIIKGTYRDAIVVDSDDVTISGNQIENVGDVGIRVIGGDGVNPQISGRRNIVSNNNINTTKGECARIRGISTDLPSLVAGNWVDIKINDVGDGSGAGSAGAKATRVTFQTGDFAAVDVSLGRSVGVCNRIQETLCPRAQILTPIPELTLPVITGSTTAQTITPSAGMSAQVVVGSVLEIESYGDAAYEVVYVTARTSTTFTAVFLNNHVVGKKANSVVFALCNPCEAEVGNTPTHISIQTRTQGTSASIQIVGASSGGVLTALGLTAATVNGVATAGIRLQGLTEGCEIKGGTVKNAGGSAVLLETSTNCLVEGVYAIGSGSQQFVQTLGSNCSWLSCHAISGLDKGFDIRGTTNHIDNCRAHSNVSIGIYDHGTSNYYGIGNIATGNNGIGVQFHMSDGTGAICATAAGMVPVASAIGLFGYRKLAASDLSAGDFGSNLVQTTGGFGSSGAVDLLPSSGVFRLRLSTTLMTLQVPQISFYNGAGSMSIDHLAKSSDIAPVDFHITAQGAWASATGSNLNGANLILRGGARGSAAGLKGGVKLTWNGSDTDVGFELAELEATARRVLSLCRGAAVTTTQMPSNTGDLVAYLSAAATDPSTGTPAGGNAIWIGQTDGKLKTKSPNGFVTTLAVK